MAMGGNLNSMSQYVIIIIIIMILYILASYSILLIALKL